MGQGRPTGTSYGAAHARIDLDLTAITAAPRVAQAAGEATAKALQQSLKIVQNEQKIAIAQAQQATAMANATGQVQIQQAKAVAQTQIAQAKAAATVQQQAATATAQVQIQQAKAAGQVQVAQAKAVAAAQTAAARQAANASSFGKNATSFAGAAIGGPIGGLVGAATGGNLAIGAGLAVNQGVRFAVDAAQIATSYNRQNIAALQLAGSQGKLNSLMAVYDKATGSIVNKSDELANVTKLQAVGFADSTKELDQFARSIRGISIAMGTSADTVTQNLILELFSQRGQRLDQLGLQYDVVRKRAAELQAQDSTLTKQMAYQQAVLEQAIDRYGKLADSSAGAGTGLEKLAKAWEDLKLSVGEDVQSPVNQAAGLGAFLLKGIEYDLKKAQEINQAIKRQAEKAADATGLTNLYALQSGMNTTQFKAQRLFNMPQPALLPSAANQIGPVSGSTARFSGEQEAVLVEWNQKRVAIERETQAAVVAEARAWGNQRLEAERAYTKTSVREARDWARQQARTQADFQQSIAKVTEDSAKQQARAERDLGRSIASEQSDSSEKVADIRKDSAKRLKDIEESYAEDRAKAARKHGDKMLDAAGHLDAKAVYEEQRDYAEQAQEAKKARDKQVKDAKEQLDERVGDEAKSLEKSIRQQKEALALRQADQAADDAQRLIDMKAQFDKEQGRAIEDRGIRLGDMAQDQQDQLDAIDRAHHDRMEQIKTHSDEEYAKLKDDYDRIFTGAGIAVKGFVDTSTDDAIKAFDKYYGHMEDKFNGKKDATQAGIPATPSSPAGFASGGWVRRGGMARVHANEFILNGGMMAGNTPIPASVRGAISNNNSRNVTFGNISVTIAGGTNMGPAEIKHAVREAMIEAYEEAA